MLDILYELPDQPPASKFVITEEVVSGRQSLFSGPVKKAHNAPAFSRLI